MLKIREKCYNKRFLSAVVISEIIVFILINFLFFFAESVANFDFWLTYIVGILIFLICVAFILPKCADKLGILLLDYNRKILLAIVIFLFLLIVFGTLLVKTGPISDEEKSIATIVFAVLGGISIPFLGFLSKQPVISIKILNDNLINDDGNISATSEDMLNIRVLCNSNNQEIIKFMGICLLKNIDDVEFSSLNNKDDLFMPLKKLSDGKEYEVRFVSELVQPHSFSNEYHLSCQDIINAAHKYGLKGTQFSIVFRNADGIYFNRLLIIKNKEREESNNKIRSTSLDEIVFITCGILLLAILITILIGDRLTLEALAAWVEAIGTILAIAIGFYQTIRQNKINKADKIEDKRPRFNVSQASTLEKKKMTVLSFEHDKTTVNEIIADNGEKYFKFLTLNISGNTIYKFAAKFEYSYDGDKENTDIFTFDGLLPGKRLVMIPKYYNQPLKIKSLIIKFTSSAGEVGFCKYVASEKKEADFEDAKYYFVKAGNKYISSDNMGEMISKGKEKFKNLDFQPVYLNNKFVYDEGN